MVRTTLFCGALLLSCAAASFAQNYFCNAGVHPDAFIDWSKLPTSPPSPQSFTATVPVTGAPGLSATIAFTNISTGGPAPLYSLSGNTSLQVNAPDGVVTITFSKPIQGIRLLANTFGRFGHNFDMQVINPAGAILPAAFDTSSAGYDGPGIGQYTSTPLEIVESSAEISSVKFTFQGDDDEYQFFGLDNVRIQLGSSDLSSLVPHNGLLQWLRADEGVVQSEAEPFASVTSWTDQSGHGSSATQSNAAADPAWVPQDGPSCQPAIRFDGSSYLTFHLPIDGLNAMTVFLVARANNDTSDGTFHSQHAALFWVENAFWGNTYVSPFQTHLAYRFGTTQVGNDPEVLRSSDIASDFTLTAAIHNGSTDSLYVNGKLLDTKTGRENTLAGMTGEGFIGQGYQNTFFTGDISEILVYDRVLSDQEREQVDYYLTTKYGLH
ncbi:MAG: LamG-like jellyroll fold domain-containing protein [Bryobacteraceae bacterium]